jgi:hypothetical protein
MCEKCANEVAVTNWKSILKADPTQWLLEEDNPSVRYWALRWLLDKSEEDEEVQLAAEAVAQSESIIKLLKRQRPEGYWGSDPRPHHGTRGYMYLFLWLGYKGNGAIRRAMDYRLDGCVHEDGAYGVEFKERVVLLPCHASDVLRQMFWFGFEEDPRTAKILRWLMSVQNEDGGFPCVSKKINDSCFWATAGVLRAIRALPREWLTPQIEESRASAIDLFLNSGLYQHRRGLGKPSPRWLEFGFPLMWDSDVLELLDLLAPHVAQDDERIQEGLKLVVEKQDSQGRWPCEKHPKGGKWMWKFIPFEEMGQPSKWVTLYALKVLRTLYSKKG